MSACFRAAPSSSHLAVHSRPWLIVVSFLTSKVANLAVVLPRMMRVHHIFHISKMNQSTVCFHQTFHVIDGKPAYTKYLLAAAVAANTWLTGRDMGQRRGPVSPLKPLEISPSSGTFTTNLGSLDLSVKGGVLRYHFSSCPCVSPSPLIIHTCLQLLTCPLFAISQHCTALVSPFPCQIFFVHPCVFIAFQPFPVLVSMVSQLPLFSGFWVFACSLPGFVSLIQTDYLCMTAWLSSKSLFELYSMS